MNTHAPYTETHALCDAPVHTLSHTCQIRQLCIKDHCSQAETSEIPFENPAAKILLLLMPAGSPESGAPCAYTLSVIEQARTVMVDKEGHFISGSSLILMKPVIYEGALTFYRQQSFYTAHRGTDAVHSGVPGFILPLLLMTANDPRRPV